MFHDNKETIGVRHKGHTVAYICHMGQMVWQAVRSCFGSGGWENDKGWDNDEGWNNG
jgi:hypothetical protein